MVTKLWWGKAVSKSYIVLMGVTIQWTGTLDWTTGLTYIWFLHILWLDLRNLASEYPYGTCSPLLKVENEPWNMRKPSLNFTTVHYATILHFPVFSNAAGISAGN